MVDTSRGYDYITGRPREHNRMQIARDLIEWARLEDSINLNKFVALHVNPPMPVTNLSKWAKEDDEFRQAYETAKAFIAFRREEFTSNDMLHIKCFDIAVLAYDGVIREQRREEAKYDSDLRKEEAKTFSESDEKKFSALMNQISSLQSERKIANNKATSENKS